MESTLVWDRRVIRQSAPGLRKNYVETLGIARSHGEFPSDMDAQLEGLQRVIRALSQPAHVQRRLYPPFTFPADEMVLEFEQFFEPTSPRYTDVWTGAQYSSLRVLDQKFLELHGPKHEELWLSEDGLDHPEWTEIRRLAREVIRVFGWDGDELPASRDLI